MGNLFKQDTGPECFLDIKCVVYWPGGWTDFPENENSGDSL